MTDSEIDPFACDLSDLTPRGVAIFEFLIGCLIQRAYVGRGKQPRRTIPPLFATLHRLSRVLDEQFDAKSATAFTLDADSGNPSGIVWATIGYSSDVVRLKIRRTVCTRERGRPALPIRPASELLTDTSQARPEMEVNWLIWRPWRRLVR